MEAVPLATAPIQYIATNTGHNSWNCALYWMHCYTSLWQHMICLMSLPDLGEPEWPEQNAFHHFRYAAETCRGASSQFLARQCKAVRTIQRVWKKHTSGFHEKRFSRAADSDMAYQTVPLQNSARLPTRRSDTHTLKMRNDFAALSDDDDNLPTPTTECDYDADSSESCHSVPGTGLRRRTTGKMRVRASRGQKVVSAVCEKGDAKQDNVEAKTVLGGRKPPQISGTLKEGEAETLFCGSKPPSEKGEIKSSATSGNCPCTTDAACENGEATFFFSSSPCTSNATCEKSGAQPITADTSQHLHVNRTCGSQDQDELCEAYENDIRERCSASLSSGDAALANSLLAQRVCRCGAAGSYEPEACDDAICEYCIETHELLYVQKLQRKTMQMVPQGA